MTRRQVANLAKTATRCISPSAEPMSITQSDAKMALNCNGLRLMLSHCSSSLLTSAVDSSAGMASFIIYTDTNNTFCQLRCQFIIQVYSCKTDSKWTKFLMPLMKTVINGITRFVLRPSLSSAVLITTLGCIRSHQTTSKLVPADTDWTFSEWPAVNGLITTYLAATSSTSRRQNRNYQKKENNIRL